MQRVLTTVARALNRIFPDCITLSQSIAFNMFLAFFPLLLLAIGSLAITSHFVDALREIPDRLSLILPPGSMAVVAAYFVRRVLRPWRWMLFGLFGTLFAGTQVMVGYMEGFRIIEGDLLGPSYWRKQLRALGLLCLTIVPMLAVVVLTVYGKQTREWIMLETGSASVTRVLELVFYGVVDKVGFGIATGGAIDPDCAGIIVGDNCGGFRRRVWISLFATIIPSTITSNNGNHQVRPGFADANRGWRERNARANCVNANVANANNSAAAIQLKLSTSVY